MSDYYRLPQDGRLRLWLSPSKTGNVYIAIDCPNRLNPDDVYGFATD